jgi:hypothetical protein
MYLICCLPPCMYIYLFAALFQFLFQTVFFIFSSIQGHGPDTQRREIDIKDSIETIDLSLHLNNVHVLFYCSYCSFHPTPALPPVADPSSIFHLPASRSYTISNLALDQKQMCWWIILLAIITGHYVTSTGGVHESWDLDYVLGKLSTHKRRRVR